MQVTNLTPGFCSLDSRKTTRLGAFHASSEVPSIWGMQMVLIVLNHD